MDFDSHPLSNDKFVDGRPEFDNRAHVLVTGGEIPVERRLAPDTGGRPVRNHFEVGCADCHSVDADEHFRHTRDGHRLVDKAQLPWITEDPRLHGFRHFPELYHPFFAS
jgi:hypothetical protein